MPDKKIYRSNKDKMVGGVCGGVAEYFDIDPTIVRLVAVLLFFAEGIGLLLYIVSWIVIPVKSSFSSEYNNNDSSDTIDVDYYSSDDDNTNKQEDKYSFETDTEDNSASEANSQKKTTNLKTDNKDEKHQSTIGIILIGLGSLFLIYNLFPYFRWHRFWPLALVGFGVVLLLKGVSDNE